MREGKHNQATDVDAEETKVQMGDGVWKQTYNLRIVNSGCAMAGGSGHLERLVMSLAMKQQ